MKPRKTLKKRNRVSLMSVEKAADIYKSMTVLHAKTKFRSFKGAFKYLLAVAYENAANIHSLQMNNRALAKAVQREKENSATQLKERLSAESRYFGLIKEYGILKAKLSSIEQNITHIDENIKTSMIPNLVRLSDDITTIKTNCDVLRNAVGTREPDTTTRNFPRESFTERVNPRIITNLNMPSPLTEESGDETLPLTARKCKGGLRNVFNRPRIYTEGGRFTNQNSTSTSNPDSFNEPNSFEGNRTVTSSEVKERCDLPSEPESSRVLPDSPGTPLHTTSPRVLPASPAVTLRRVLTPVDSNSSDLVHSTTPTEISFNIEDDNSRVIHRNGRRRSAHSTFFVKPDESGGDGRSFVTERKKSKRSYFKGNDENRYHQRRETLTVSLHDLNGDANHDPSENLKPRRSSTSKRKSSRSSFCENIISPENFSLIGERKRYRTRSVTRSSIQNQSDVSAEEKQSIQNTTFGSETTSENPLDDSRRLRTRARNVCYKERPLNVKLRKN